MAMETGSTTWRLAGMGRIWAGRASCESSTGGRRRTLVRLERMATGFAWENQVARGTAKGLGIRRCRAPISSGRLAFYQCRRVTYRGRMAIHRFLTGGHTTTVDGVDAPIGNLAHTSKHALTAPRHVACRLNPGDSVVHRWRTVQHRFLNDPPLRAGSFRFPPVRRVVRMRPLPSISVRRAVGIAVALVATSLTAQAQQGRVTVRVTDAANQQPVGAGPGADRRHHTRRSYGCGRSIHHPRRSRRYPPGPRSPRRLRRAEEAGDGHRRIRKSRSTSRIDCRRDQPHAGRHDRHRSSSAPWNRATPSPRSMRRRSRRRRRSAASMT